MYSVMVIKALFSNLIGRRYRKEELARKGVERRVEEREKELQVLEKEMRLERLRKMARDGNL